LTVRADCACGHRFEADDALAGGFANCPKCGRAAGVPGLRDPAWRLLQAGAVVLWVVATAVAWKAGGPAVGLLAGAALGLLLWLLSRAL
jgi:hypothetical protein